MFQMSERRACSVIAADRTSIRYQFCRPPDTELRCRLRNPDQLRRSPVAHTAPQGASTAEALTVAG
jgi:hypothetical protein